MSLRVHSTAFAAERKNQFHPQRKGSKGIQLLCAAPECEGPLDVNGSRAQDKPRPLILLVQHGMCRHQAAHGLASDEGGHAWVLGPRLSAVFLCVADLNGRRESKRRGREGKGGYFLKSCAYAGTLPSQTLLITTANLT